LRYMKCKQVVRVEQNLAGISNPLRPVPCKLFLEEPCCCVQAFKAKASNPGGGFYSLIRHLEPG
jgi:hypothetical protein